MSTMATMENYQNQAQMEAEQSQSQGGQSGLQQSQEHNQQHGQHQGQQQQATAGIPGKDDERKLFVGGLSRNTTDKELREHFGKFGEIESISVKIDPHTGISRGFAFMVFTNPKTIDKLLASGEHYINKRKVSRDTHFLRTWDYPPAREKIIIKHDVRAVAFLLIIYIGGPQASQQKASTW